MKLKLEIEVPEFEWVDAQKLYKTPLGDFHDQYEIDRIGDLIGYLQRLDEIEFIINSDHQHVRHPFCRELVRSRLDFIPEGAVWRTGEILSHFLMGFRKGVGYDFSEYKYEYHALSNGKKIRFKEFSMMFDKEEDAMRHIARIYTSKKDFEFDVV